jgi:hypothetical protein
MSRDINYNVNTIHLPVTVKLIDTGGNVIQQNNHSDNGSYTFSNVDAGNYSINVVDNENCGYDTITTIPTDVDFTCNINANVISPHAGEISIDQVAITNPSILSTNPVLVYVYKRVDITQINWYYEVVYHKKYYAAPGTGISIYDLEGGDYHVLLHDTSSEAKCYFNTDIHVAQIIPCNLNYDIWTEPGEENVNMFYITAYVTDPSIQTWAEVEIMYGGNVYEGTAGPTRETAAFFYNIPYHQHISILIIDNTSTELCTAVIEYIYRPYGRS